MIGLAQACEMAAGGGQGSPRKHIGSIFEQTVIGMGKVFGPKILPM
jgi:hypothetical protein